jgi:hypothetical protein
MNWEGKNDKKTPVSNWQVCPFFPRLGLGSDFLNQRLLNSSAFRVDEQGCYAHIKYIHIHKLNMIRSRTVLIELFFPVSCRINGHGASILIGRATAEQPFQVMFNTYKYHMCRLKILPSMLNVLSWLNHFNIFNHPQLMTMSNPCWIPKQFAATVLRPWPMGCASSGSNNWST